MDTEVTRWVIQGSFSYFLDHLYCPHISAYTHTHTHTHPPHKHYQRKSPQENFLSYWTGK